LLRQRADAGGGRISSEDKKGWDVEFSVVAEDFE